MIKNYINIFEVDKWPKKREEAEKTAKIKGFETLLCINDLGVFMGRSKSGIWCVGLPDELKRVYMFLKYENSNNRKVIIWSENMDKALNMYKSINEELAINKTIDNLLLCDSKYLCHSTCIENFYSILKDGALLSYSEQIRLNRTINTVRHELKEPEDYFDYIDLCIDSSISSEIVVASRQFGKINDDSDIKYKPGVRTYFHIDEIKNVNGICCDGLHALKVYKKLPLNAAHAFVFPSKKEYEGFILNCGLDIEEKLKSKFIYLEEKEYWTPSEYLEKANNAVR